MEKKFYDLRFAAFCGETNTPKITSLAWYKKKTNWSRKQLWRMQSVNTTGYQSFIVWGGCFCMTKGWDIATNQMTPSVGFPQLGSIKNPNNVGIAWHTSKLTKLYFLSQCTWIYILNYIFLSCEKRKSGNCSRVRNRYKSQANSSDTKILKDINQHNDNCRRRSAKVCYTNCVLWKRFKRRIDMQSEGEKLDQFR